MLLTPHVFAGMLFGSLSNDYRYAPLLGLLSYFFLELIPHWDPENDSRMIIKVIRYIDFCIAIISFVIVIFLYTPSQDGILGATLDPRLVLGGIFGALPYIILYFSKLLWAKNKTYLATEKILSTFKYTDHSFWGILIQFSVCVICVAVIFQLIDFPTWEKIRDGFGYPNG
jgi:hypothetical protein